VTRSAAAIAVADDSVRRPERKSLRGADIHNSSTEELVGNLAQTRHVERVRWKLLQLARSYGQVVRDGIRIDFPVSHALLAEMIGSSPETVRERSINFSAPGL
jgi:CRP-like cAMP-binding protein